MILTVGRKKATCATSPEGRWLQPRAGWPSRWKYNKTYIFPICINQAYFFQYDPSIFFNISKAYLSNDNQAYQGSTLILMWDNCSYAEQWPTWNVVTVKIVIKMIKYWQYFRSSTTDISTAWSLCLTSSLLLWRRREKEKKELIHKYILKDKNLEKIIKTVLK